MAETNRVTIIEAKKMARWVMYRFMDEFISEQSAINIGKPPYYVYFGVSIMGLKSPTNMKANGMCQIYTE